MSENNQSDKQQFLLGLFGGIALVAVIGVIVMAVLLVKSNNGQVAGETQTGDNTNTGATGSASLTAAEIQAIPASSIKTFTEKAGATVCQEGGKPVVYLFSTTWCPHCKWIKGTFDTWAKAAEAEGKIKAYHWEVDTGDDSLTAAVETQLPAEAQKIYQEFNPQGSIPTFVFGCKYSRIGNGYESASDLKPEVGEYKAVAEALLK